MKKRFGLLAVGLFPVVALAGPPQSGVAPEGHRVALPAKVHDGFTLTVTAHGARGESSFTGVTKDGFPLKWRSLSSVTYIAHANPANVKNSTVNVGTEVMLITGNRGLAYVAGSVSWLAGLKTHREQGRMIQVPVVRDFSATESVRLARGQSATFFMGGDRVEVARNS